jgi:hypothetical protein
MTTAEKKKPGKKRVRVVFSAGQVFDSDAQAYDDVEKVLSVLHPHVLLGTESGDRHRKETIERACERLGYMLYAPYGTDGWIAARKTFLRAGWIGNCIDVLPSGRQAGDPHHYQAKGVVSLSWYHTSLGGVGFAVTHALTLGRRPGQEQEDALGDPVDHYEANDKLMRALTQHGDRMSERDGCVWLAADSNQRDQDVDVLRQTEGGRGVRKWQTGWDEIGHHPSTLDGSTSTIDIIATRVDQPRIQLKAAFVADDLHLNSDHKAVVHDYDVRKIR